MQRLGRRQGYSRLQRYTSAAFTDTRGSTSPQVRESRALKGAKMIHPFHPRDPRSGQFPLAPQVSRPLVPPSRDPHDKYRRGHFITSYRSVKSGRQVRCESFLEHKVASMLEACDFVSSFSEQPGWLKLRIGKTTSRYTPDFVAVTCLGKPWLIEVKPSDEAKTPKWQRKARAARQAAARKGHLFAMVTEQHVAQIDKAALNAELQARHAAYVCNLGTDEESKRSSNPKLQMNLYKVFQSAFSDAFAAELEERFPGGDLL